MKRPLLVTGVLLVLALAACTPTPPAPSPSTSSASPTPTPTPTPSPTPSPAALTCENLVDPATLAAFTASGLSITPPADFDTKLHDEGNYFAAFFDAGGILCQVGGATSATEMYGFALMPYGSTEGTALVTGLLSEGYVQTSGDGGEYFELDASTDSVARHCYLTSVFAVCAIDNARLEEVRRNAGYAAP